MTDTDERVFWRTAVTYAIRIVKYTTACRVAHLTVWSLDAFRHRLRAPGRRGPVCQGPTDRYTYRVVPYTVRAVLWTYSCIRFTILHVYRVAGGPPRKQIYRTRKGTLASSDAVRSRQEL